MVTWLHTTLTPPCSPGEMPPCNLKEVYNTCNKSWSYYIMSKVNQYVQSQSTTKILPQGRRIAGLPRVLAIQISLQAHPSVRWDTMRQFVVHHWCWIRALPKSWVWDSYFGLGWLPEKFRKWPLTFIRWFISLMNISSWNVTWYMSKQSFIRGSKREAVQYKSCSKMKARH